MSSPMLASNNTAEGKKGMVAVLVGFYSNYGDKQKIDEERK